MKLSLVVAVVVSLFVFTLAVNRHSATMHNEYSAIVADGNPAPPFPPSAQLSGSRMARDGNPAPPFPPSSTSIPSGPLLADGNPSPPFPPSGLLTADGNPAPPFPPANRLPRVVAYV